MNKAADCTRNCWLAGAVAGLLVWLLSWVTAALSPLTGLVFGLLTMWFLARFLIWGLCSDTRRSGDDALVNGADWGATIVPPVQLAAEVAPADQALAVQPLADQAALQPAVQPLMAAPVDAVAKPAEVSADEPAPVAVDDVRAKKKAKKEKAAKKAAKAAKSAEKTKAKTRIAKLEKGLKEVSKGRKKAKAGKDEAKAEAALLPADDLKQIKGIGPKLEKVLTAEGITRFEHVAALGDEQIDALATKLGRLGSRIRSDDWVAQAKTLAAGGATEFSSRVRKGEVYE